MEESNREYPLLSIVLGIATAILLVVVVIVVAMLARCGGSAAVTGSSRRSAGWREKQGRGSSSPDLLVQIESGEKHGSDLMVQIESDEKHGLAHLICWFRYIQVRNMGLAHLICWF